MVTMNVAHSSTASTRVAAASTPERDAAEPEGFKDCFEKAARWVAGKAVGLVFGTSGFVVNAAAGGARGVVHGTRLKEAWFHVGMAGNLALAGALTGGPPGVALGVIGGELIWRIQGEEVRDRVEQRSDEWVDWSLEKLGGDPDQAGVARRVVNGVVGEVAGAVGGALAGSLAMFERGEALGQEFADRMFGGD